MQNCSALVGRPRKMGRPLRLQQWPPLDLAYIRPFLRFGLHAGHVACL